jgi:osmoprotectant transport system substrate-binding protein
VTREFAEEWDLTTIDDLANLTTPLTLGGNSEGENRANGPRGLSEAYGIDVDFAPIEDGGGPLTVGALHDGDIQLAIIYTADPSIEANDLVSLEDTAGLFLASHVVPLASDAVDAEAADVINAVSGAMTAEELVALNGRSVNEELPAATIASDWLADNDLT